MTTHISAWLMIVFLGLVSGGQLIYAVERVNLWKRMPLDQYVVDFRRSLYRVDPLLPIFAAISGLSAVVFALQTDGRPAMLAWIGAGLIAVMAVASVSIGEPINSRFRRLAEGGAPDDAEKLRVVWRRFHVARTAVTLSSLGFLVAAAI